MGQYEDMLNEARRTLEEARSEYASTLEAMELDIINLVMDISKKVISSEIDVNKQCVVSLVREAIVKCPARDELVIGISPQDRAVIEESSDMINRAVNGRGYEIKEDPSLAGGNCIIDTSFGSMDAGVDSRLELIRETFGDVLTGAKPQKDAV